MKHFGDITKIDGHTVPIVDVVTGGSPCQDLSIAGGRAGLSGERSGLFIEQIRIVKEMREKDAESKVGTTEPIRPRILIWENVPGALSSGTPKGADFQAVLTEIVRIVQPDAPDVPLFGGEKQWAKSGVLLGYGADGKPFSVAYRVHDAQYWGVPQRRRRISLVADFGGTDAGEWLFEKVLPESEGMSGNTEQGEETRKETAEDSGRCIDAAGGTVSYGMNRERCGAVIAKETQPTIQAAAGESGNNKPMVCCTFTNRANDNRHEVAETVRAECHGALPMVCVEGNGARPSHQGDGYSESETMYTLNATEQHVVAYNGTNITSPQNRVDPHPGDPCHTLHTGNRNILIQVYDARGNGDGETVPTITGDHNSRVTDYIALRVGNGQTGTICMETFHCNAENELVPPLKARDYKDPTAVAVTVDRKCEDCAAVDCRNGTENAETNGTLQAKESGGISVNYNNIIRTDAVVRRLTPKECERLQAFPDDWTKLDEWVDSKGKKHKESDSPRYKALGNSIALPFWQWLANRICADYDRPVEIASLFDGIGGFPLVFERAGGRAVWASEIEEFPIAVTKLRFPE